MYRPHQLYLSMVNDLMERAPLNLLKKWKRRRAKVINKPLLFAWVTSIIALGGSLFFSEQMGFIPCTLCWFQRILMYPLTILLGIAFYKNDKEIYKYVLPFSVMGMLVST